MLEYRVLPAGDTALVVEFGDRIDQKLNAAVLALSHGLDAAQIPGITETIPTFRSLMVHYEPLELTASALVGQIEKQMHNLNTSASVGHVWHLPVCYDPDVAIDLDDVARRTSLTV